MLNWLFGNLYGAMGQRWFMVAMITLLLTMKGTLIVFQMQKESLRDDISDIKAQLSKTQAEHVSEIKRITVKNNQTIKDMISKEEVVRLQAELENEKNKAKVELEANKDLNEKLKKLQSIKLDKCEFSPELREIINGVIR